MPRLDKFTRPLLAAAVLLTTTLLQATELRVEVGSQRAPGSVFAITDAAVIAHARQTALLGHKQLESMASSGRLRTPFTLPLRVVLTQNGIPLPINQNFRAAGGGDIVPTFDTNPPFPSTYKTLLQDTFTMARPAMNAVFGTPAIGGVVHISNFDATIQDRYAVGGGYYVPNAPVGPEIRFPVYNSTVAASINYVHCLLLAYQGLNPYPFDALNEGLVRAATMRVVRTPGSLPGSPTSNDIEAVLDSLYDISAFYDWYNQPALGCATFIAPNLLNTQLPAGGSTGGIFLTRYLMAGTALSKVSTEHPGFIAEFNTRYYLSPGSYTSMADFTVLGQQVLDFLVGGVGTVEGKSFANWVERQYILDVATTAGLKIMVQPFPIQATGGTSDFGVYGFDVNAFRTSANGNEALLAGSAFPIYWRPDFTRFFMSVQDDELRFSAAYASVVPNFPSATFANKQYRVAVDVPFAGNNQRVVLPAGSYSTGSAPLPKNFIGTLTGLPVLSAGTYEVSVEWVGGSLTGIAVDNFAFGANVGGAFVNAQPVTVRVFVNNGGLSEVFSRRVNKGFGMLALDLSPPESDMTYSFSSAAKLDMLGLPLQAYRISPASLFGIATNQLLFATWNPTFVRYDLYPDAGQVMNGQGFFLRPPSSVAVDVHGYAPPRTPVAVSLQPGWNIVSVPFDQTIATTNVSFTVQTEAISTFAQASGSIIGNTVFEFDPDATNPDAGTMLPATNFVGGRAYMVRVLRPEGAVMVFTPNDPMRPTAAAYSNPVSGPQWETRIIARNSDGKTTHVVVGQNKQTFRGWDPRFDSELPPSPGGFQAAIVGTKLMYKEIGYWNDAERYRVTITGLKPGERVTLEFEPTSGDKTLTFRDLLNSRSVTTRNGRATYTFTATGTTRSFDVATGYRA